MTTDVIKYKLAVDNKADFSQDPATTKKIQLTPLITLLASLESDLG